MTFLAFNAFLNFPIGKNSLCSKCIKSVAIYPLNNPVSSNWAVSCNQTEIFIDHNQGYTAVVEKRHILKIQIRHWNHLIIELLWDETPYKLNGSKTFLTVFLCSICKLSLTTFSESETNYDVRRKVDTLQ